MAPPEEGHLPPSREENLLPTWLAIVFFASGFSALSYQLVWQRALFTIYGIDIQSVTIVVSAFMLGLGIGSLAGGYASKRWPRRAVLGFALAELGIGAYGLASLRIFDWAAAATLQASSIATAFVTFGLVLVPTLLMGATLPLLVGHAVARGGSVGSAVGALYGINTVGSALACFATALLLFDLLGLEGTTAMAAGLNLLGGAFAWRCARSTPGPDVERPHR